MISIGLDLSINSTGVCVFNSEDHTSTYYIIGSKFTAKALHSNLPPNVSLIQYVKHTVDSTLPYEKREEWKTSNIYNIVLYLQKIVLKHNPDVVCIEGVSFGSTGSAALIDLSGLNYMVRMMLINTSTPYIITTPTQNKKFATGNGQAEKDVMISAWEKCDNTPKQIPSCVKKDDLADAYFLSRYGLSLI